MRFDIVFVEVEPRCPRCHGELMPLLDVVWPLDMLWLGCLDCGRLSAIGGGDRPEQELLENWGGLISHGCLTAGAPWS